MGRKLRDEDLHLNIIVNGDKAKKELGQLEAETRELKNTNKSLRMEKSKLNKEDKDYKNNLKRLNQEIKENNAAIRKNESRMKELRSEIGITGLTMNQLRKEQSRLRIALNNATYGTPQFRKLRAELDKVEARMTKVRGQSHRMKLSMGRVADTFNRFAAIGATVVATLTGLVFSMKEFIQGNAKLDDAMADVMKTTGLTKTEVRELNSEFKYMNTRSSRRELLALAEEAGRLGKKGKKDILDFVEVANQIKVALGDDLGGDAEVAIREVGKLTEIYRVGKKYGADFRQSMLMVGSSINEVSANSQAQAGYLIELTKRLAGVSAQADISVDDIIGIAAALDAMGQRSEVSATTLNKVIVNMFKDVETYSELAGQSTQEFSELLNTDANEALLRVLDGLNGNNEGLSVMAQKLDGLGLDGSRSVQVLAALASNTKLIREQQDLANRSLEEATSLTNEYNVKNNNMAGNLEKIGRALRAAFINSNINKALDGIVSRIAKWFEIPMSEKLEKEKEEVNLLVKSIISLNDQEEARGRLIEELQRKYPGFLKNIDVEKATNEDLLALLSEINLEYEKRIRLSVYEEQLTEITEKSKDVIMSQDDAIKQINKLYEKYITNKNDEASLDEKIGALLSEKYDKLALQKDINDEIYGVYASRSDTEIAVRGAVKDLVSDYNNLIEEQILLENEYQEIILKRADITGGISPTDQPQEGDTKTLDGQVFIYKNGKWVPMTSETPGEGGGEEPGSERFAEIEYIRALAAEEIKITEEKIEAIQLRESGLGEWLREQREKDLRDYLDKLNRMRSVADSFATDLGRLIGSSMGAQSEAAAKFAENFVLIALDALRKVVLMSIAEITAKQIAEKGFLGIATSAALITMIEAAFSLAESAVKSPPPKLNQFETGYYDVIGRQDGKKYHAKQVSNAGTGLISQPSILVGEKPEIIIDPATTRNLQINYPGIIAAINSARVPQFASGHYPANTKEVTTIEKAYTDPTLYALIQEMKTELAKGLRAYLVADEDYIDIHKDIATQHNDLLNEVNG